MADNFVTNAGSGGSTFASDDVGGVQYPRMKPTWGADGVASDVNLTTPFPVQQAALYYPASTANSSTAQIAAGATYSGTIETILSLQAAQIEIVCDQPYTLIVNQYIDAAGVYRSSQDIFVRAAGVPFNQNITLPGNYFNIQIINNGAAATTGFRVDTTFGIMSTSPRGLGKKDQNDALPVTLSNDDGDILNAIAAALAVLKSGKHTDGSLRTTSVGGSLSTLTTLSNVAGVGGYNVNGIVQAQGNLTARIGNINNCIG